MQRFRDLIFEDGLSYSSVNVRLGFCFADLIFVVCQSTAKTVKIGSLENFRLYTVYTITYIV